MALGRNDLKNVVLPTAWDQTELSRIALRDGTTYDAVVRDINTVFATVSSNFGAGYLGNLFSWTDEATVEYANGLSGEFEDMTENTQPDAQRGDTTGHMLPIKDKDRKLGWTTLFLENARRTQIDNDINIAAEAATNTWEKALLTRLFKMEEETGAGFGLGSTGVSVGFADGGAGTVDFTPISRLDRAAAFASTHDHYLRLNGITQANLETAVAHLWEHGHDAPYDLIAAQADLAAWQTTANVTGWKDRVDPLIQFGTTTDTARVGDVYHGAILTKYGSVRLYTNARIPTTFWAVTKVYGANDMRNPLRVRFDDMFGRGIKLYVENIELYPLKGAIARMKFGVGVGDRSSAVLVRNDSSGDYTTPTIG